MMIFHLRNQLSGLLTVLAVLFLNPAVLFAQYETHISPYVTFQYFKDTNNERFLQTILTYSVNRMEVPLKGMGISFYSGFEDKIHVSTVTTDENGVARVGLGSNIKLPVNDDGFWEFSTEFRGNDSVEAAISELVVKDLKFEMMLSEIDSIKTISLTAFTLENAPMSFIDV